MDKKNDAILLKTLRGLERRFIGYSCTPNELFPIFNKVNDLSGWCREFSEVAERFEKVADSIEDDDLIKSTIYYRAVIHFQIAQLGLHEDTEEKKRAFLSSVRAYEKAAKYFWVPVQLVEYPFRNTMLSAYFRKAPGAEKAPCILLIKGLDSSSEAEGHNASDYLLQKGFSTLAIDCPGQYQARFKGLSMTPDFEKPVAAAIDYLETRSDVDLDRIAIFGTSFGGFIAPRAAAFEKRIKACISAGGFYSLTEFDFNTFFTLQLLNCLKISADDFPRVRKDYSLEGIIENITCPLLVVNGAQDTVQPIACTVKIYEKARCEKDLKLYEGLNHCAWIEKKSVLTDMADWLISKLYRNK